MFQQLKSAFERNSFPPVSPEIKQKIKERKKELAVHKLWVKKVVSKRDYDSYYKYDPNYYIMGNEEKGVKLAYVIAKEIWDRYPYLRNNPKTGQQMVFPLTDNEYLGIAERDFPGQIIRQGLFTEKETPDKE